MRLNWFSPLPPERTDIAHYTARIAAALMSRFEVVFWTDLKTDVHALPPGAQVRRFDPAHIEGRDFNRPLFEGLNVYNLGNDARFHAGLARLAERIPGLVILHDTRLHHFVFERSRRDEPRFSTYLALARATYGAEGEAKARSVIATEGRAIDSHLEAMPFVEPFMDQALGAVCHSRAASEDARRRSATPILTLPLPFMSLSPAVRTMSETPAPRATRRWAAPWRLVMFGYLGSNRRLESVLQALASWRPGAEVRLDIYGALGDRAAAEALIAHGGLQGRVSLHGFVPEPVLDQAIAQAHLAFNLRHPTMGEASGGILRSWAHATPALVTDAGWYADLPDEVARRIAVETEVADIRQALDDLVEDPGGYERMGLAARARLQALHRPEAYAASLLAALEAALPRLTARLAGRRLLTRSAAAAPTREERTALLGRASEHIPALFARDR